jgi:hypothetical protein
LVRVGGARSSRRSVDHHWDEFRDSTAELFERPLANCHENQPGQKPWRRGGVEESVPRVGHSQQRKNCGGRQGIKDGEEASQTFQAEMADVFEASCKSPYSSIPFIFHNNSN